MTEHSEVSRGHSTPAAVLRQQGAGGRTER